MHYYIAAYLLLLLVVVTNSKGLSIINLINIHTYIHTYILMQTNSYIHTHTYILMHTYSYIHTYIDRYILKCTFIHEKGHLNTKTNIHTLIQIYKRTYK